MHRAFTNEPGLGNSHSKTAGVWEYKRGPNTIVTSKSKVSIFPTCGVAPNDPPRISDCPAKLRKARAEGVQSEYAHLLDAVRKRTCLTGKLHKSPATASQRDRKDGAGPGVPSRTFALLSGTGDWRNKRRQRLQSTRVRLQY